MQYWDEVLFPEVLTLISGERYLSMSDRAIADELIVLAKSAINTFLFPYIPLDYDYEDTDSPIQPRRYYFIGDVGDRELHIIIQWMNFYWCKKMVSNADNFQNVYFDTNIKSFSPGNILHNYRVLMENYRDEARRAESRYYRMGDYTGGAPIPDIGGTIDDD